MLETFPLV